MPRLLIAKALEPPKRSMVCGVNLFVKHFLVNPGSSHQDRIDCGLLEIVQDWVEAHFSLSFRQLLFAMH